MTTTKLPPRVAEDRVRQRDLHVQERVCPAPTRNDPASRVAVRLLTARNGGFAAVTVGTHDLSLVMAELKRLRESQAEENLLFGRYVAMQREATA